MTIREWYAGQALAMVRRQEPGCISPDEAEHIADIAFDIADAMIERAKR